MVSSPRNSGRRVLVLAPTGKDALLTRDILGGAGIQSEVCTSIRTLCQALESGAGALLLTEEALEDRDLALLERALDSQPPWSDVATLLFAGDGRPPVSPRTLWAIDALRNVTLLERPIRLTAVLSAVRSALRSRDRQYEVRDLLMELQQSRREAEHANRLKDEFLATLSHELRTPLNAILGWTAMLAHGQVAAERTAEALEIIARNAQAQAQLVDDVLDVSRIITGKLQLHLSTVDAGEVVQRAIDAVRPAAQGRGVTLDTSLDPQPLVDADPDRLQQVCWNLLTNAVKFTPPGGHVRVRVEHKESNVAIVVSDDGVGIAPEFLPHVFDRFRQADQSTTRPFGGLGLGLAIVRHLVELHGGQVSVTSQGLDTGATFRVLLRQAQSCSHGSRRDWPALAPP